MKENEDFKNTINQLSKTRGKVKGACMKGMKEYLERIGKEEKIPEIEKKLAEYGFPLKLNEVSAMKWYPIATEVALIFSIKEVLGWKEKEIKELGRNIPKLSFIVRLLMKFFLSPKVFFQEIPTYWEKHFNFGEMEALELNQKKKYMIVRVKDFNLHPLYCQFLSGFFETMVRFVIKSEKAQARETKCTFKGQFYHEFKVSWQ